MSRTVIALGVLITTLVVSPLHGAVLGHRLTLGSPEYIFYRVTSLLCFPLGLVAAWGIASRMSRQQSLPSKLPSDWRITAGICIYGLYWGSAILYEVAIRGWLGFNSGSYMRIATELLWRLPFGVGAVPPLGAALVLWGMASVLLLPGRFTTNESRPAQ